MKRILCAISALLFSASLSFGDDPDLRLTVNVNTRPAVAVKAFISWQCDDYPPTVPEEFTGAMVPPADRGDCTPELIISANGKADLTRVLEILGVLAGQ